MKKKYEVLAEMSHVLKAYVEAENEDEAYQLAREKEGDEFEMVEGSGDWNVYNVCEVENVLIKRGR